MSLDPPPHLCYILLISKFTKKGLVSLSIIYTLRPTSKSVTIEEKIGITFLFFFFLNIPLLYFQAPTAPNLKSTRQGSQVKRVSCDKLVP